MTWISPPAWDLITTGSTFKSSLIVFLPVFFQTVLPLPPPWTNLRWRSVAHMNAGSPAREKSLVRQSTSEHTEPLRFQHQNILKTIHQYGRMADTTAAQPAELQRRMAAMKVEQEEERERLEDARRRAQSAGESVEAQLNIARDENEGLRSELRIAEAARDDARRSVDVSIEKQVDLKRDLRSALSELEVPAPLSAPLPRRPSLGAPFAPFCTPPHSEPLQPGCRRCGSSSACCDRTMSSRSPQPPRS